MEKLEIQVRDSNSASNHSGLVMDNGSNASEEAIIETLRSRGWCFGDTEPVKAVIMICFALADNPSMVVDSVASELINMDLKSFGGKSLPEPHILRKSSYVLGPKVLQVSSVRDIGQSSLNGQSGDHRLLRLGLTDGHSEITAIEYSHVPAITDNVIPGTKVCLVNKAIIRSGIVCLNPKVISVLGGTVQTLFEEWQMNQKYSGTSRLPTRLSLGGNAGGPPPFEKLQIERPSHQFVSKDYVQFASKNSRPTTAVPPSMEINPSDRKQSTSGAEVIDTNKTSLIERTEEKPSNSVARTKEVVEAVPVQNQAASQKLLQRMGGQNGDNRPSRGRRQRGKGKIEDPVVFTLDEYEKRKAGGNHLRPETSHDEALALELQNQFDLEDSQVPSSGHNKSQAEHIRMSMFSYERDDDEEHHMNPNGRRGGRRGSRGKGGWRGRGRGRTSG